MTDRPSHGPAARVRRARLVTASVAACAVLGGVGISVLRPTDTEAVARATASAPVKLLENRAPAVPLSLGAGHGHVVAVRATAAGSELLDLTPGSAARVVTTFPGGPAVSVTVGTDAAGTPVAVVSPCAPKADPTARVKRCALVAVDLTTGKQQPIPHTTGSLLGDLDGGRVAITRYVRGVPRILAATEPGGRPRTRSLTRVIAATTRDSDFDPAATYVEAFDLEAGVIAATIRFLSFADDAGGRSGGSVLIQSRGGGAWQRLARSGYGLASGIPRIYIAPRVTRTGVTAVYDSGDQGGGYAGRWSPAGKLVKRVPSARFGGQQEYDHAVLFGNTLIASRDAYVCPPSPGPDDDISLCDVKAYGPVKLG